MSIKYDGASFDSVEELVEYKKLMNASKPTTSAKVDEPVQLENRNFKSKRRVWTEDEIELIKFYYQKYFQNLRISKKGLGILSRKINRTRAAIGKKVWERPDLSELVQKLKEGKKPIFKPKSVKKRKKVDGRVIRMRFISSRLKYLMDNDKYMNIEKARRQAIEEYNIQHNIKPSKGKIQKKVKQVTSEDLEFPSIYPLSDEGIKSFEHMVVDLIARPDSKIDFITARNFLQLVPGKEWEGRLWRDFCAQFLLNKKKICKALNCNDRKLKVVVERGYHVIRYEQ